jgi:hypothetical protein
MTILPPQLPVELWLKIFEDVETSDLWLSVRNVNRAFRECIDDIAKARIVCFSSISTIFSLGSGNQHCWYDVRGTIELDFKEVSQQNPPFAEFEIAAFRPDVFAPRVAEKWNRICTNGIDQGLIWNITMMDSHGPSSKTTLPNCYFSRTRGLRSDWRLMLCSYFTQIRKAHK